MKYIISQTKDTVTISKEYYEELWDDRNYSDALREAGVNNWEGHGNAMEILERYRRETDHSERD